jgi:hypothetical protein
VRYLVTVKLKKNPDHNPHDKKTQQCPLDMDSTCTDATGEHHTALVSSVRTIGEVKEQYERLGYHVTRVETVSEVIEHHV